MPKDSNYFSLEIYEDDNDPWQFDLSQAAKDYPIVTIGRAANTRPNHISFRCPNPNLAFFSRIHATFSLAKDGRVSISDGYWTKSQQRHRSLTGTWVNGKQINKMHLLKLGDIVTFTSPDYLLADLKSYRCIVTSDATVPPQEIETQAFQIKQVFRAISSQSPEGVAVLHMGKTVFRVMLHDDQFCEVLGRQPDEMSRFRGCFSTLFRERKEISDVLRSHSEHARLSVHTYGDAGDIRAIMLDIAVLNLNLRKYYLCRLSPRQTVTVTKRSDDSWQSLALQLSSDLYEENPLLFFVVVLACLTAALAFALTFFQN